MSRLPAAKDRVVNCVDEALFMSGEIKVFLTKEERLVRYLGGLDEADGLELAHAQADVEAATTRLRAARGRLIQVEERKAQKREIRKQILADFDLEEKEMGEGARVIALDAAAVGITHIHPDLLTGCSPAEKARI